MPSTQVRAPLKRPAWEATSRTNERSEVKAMISTAKSKKGCFGDWSFVQIEQCNDLLEWAPNIRFPMPNSQCPKQPLLNQLYKQTFIGERIKTETLLCDICLKVLHFLLFSFSRLFLWDSFTAMFGFCFTGCDLQLTYGLCLEVNAILAKQTGETRTLPLLNASKYCTGLLLDNPTGP